MEIRKTNEFMEFNIVSEESDFIKLFLLKLRLYLKYEDSFLFLSFRSYYIVKVAILSYLSSLNQTSFEKSVTVEIGNLIFSVCSKIFNYDEINNQFFHLNLIRKSMLSEFGGSFLLDSGKFWKSYFDYKYIQSIEQSNKLKVLKICENMIFYNFFLSKDIDYTCKLIQDVIPFKNINMRVVRKNVISKLGKVLYKANGPREHKNKFKVLSKTKKLIECLILCYKCGYLDSEIVIKIISLNSEIKKGYLESLIKIILVTKSLEGKERFFYYLKYIQYSEWKRVYEFSKTPVFNISPEDKDQIHIDMVRTKQWKGKEYQNKLEILTLDFISRYKDGLGYFQGFNYIMAFFYKNLSEKEELFTILDFMTNTIINVS